MEEEQSILDATEYVLMALNNIKNFEEFIEYKEEITKAIYDIRNSITSLINLKKYNNNNINQNNEKINSNNDTSSISAMLGLKFNYDAYLKDIQIQNFYQNEPVLKNNMNQEIQNDNLNLKLINNNNNLNDDNLINNKISNNSNINNNLNKINKNNLTHFSFQEENDNIDPIQNNDDNIAYNKSIRNKFKVMNNSNDNNVIKNNTNLNDNINNNNNINNISESIYPNPKKQDLMNNQKGINKKEKLSLIADIIMKINSEDYFYEILTKLFGEDLTDKLMSSDVSDELLESVQNSIKEIEELKRRDDLKSQNQNNNIKKTNSEEIEEKPKRFPIEKIMNPNIKQNMNRNSSNKKLNNEKKNNYQEFNFQNNLRKNSSQENYGKNNKKNSSSKKEKPFISATSAYGNYFDPPLQKGGLSKLDDFKKS